MATKPTPNPVNDVLPPGVESQPVALEDAPAIPWTEDEKRWLEQRRSVNAKHPNYTHEEILRLLEEKRRAEK